MHAVVFGVYTVLLVVGLTSRLFLCEYVRFERLAYSGDTVIMACRPSVSFYVLWAYTPPGQNEELDVCVHGHISKRFQPRFSFDDSVSGYQNLIIIGAFVNDTGIYSCIEDGGLSDRRITIHLVVLELTRTSTTELKYSVTPARTDSERSITQNCATCVVEENVTGFVGETATFYCPSTYEFPPAWSFRGWPEILVGSIEKEIANGWILINGYAKRSKVEKYTDGYIYILDDLRYSDTGMYKCTENGGQSKLSHVTALYVIEQRQAINGVAFGLGVCLLIALLFIVFLLYKPKVIRRCLRNRAAVPVLAKHANSLGRYRIRPDMEDLLVRAEITGMACLDGVIYVACRNSDTLKIFDCSDKDTAITTEWTVQGMKQPVDIVPCPTTSTLYILDDQTPPCIWRVPLHADETTRFEKYPLYSADKSVQLLARVASTHRQIAATDTVVGPVSMSIRKKYLLITTPDRLLMYNASDCFRLEDIILPEKMRAHYATETVVSTFIVCHQRTADGKEISEIDRNCNILRGFGFESNTAGYPRHLAIDGDGRIFVIDNTNGKLFILNRELKFLLEYENVSDLTNRGICTRICLDADSSRLLVGSGKSYVVRVYNVRKSSPSHTLSLQTDTPSLPWLKLNCTALDSKGKGKGHGKGKGKGSYSYSIDEI